MAKDSRLSTYNRIIEASLVLFNEEGERNISTNHIATYLSISPGNLYYHFRNKDEIIIQLFKRYCEDLLQYLHKAALPINVPETIHYVSGIYDVMWQYRFLFSDVNNLLSRSADLLGEHNNFTHVKVSPLLISLLTRLNELKVIQADQQAMQDMAINMWIVTKYWFDFDGSLRGRTKLITDSKIRGVQRTLSLLRPYIIHDHLAEFDKMLASLTLNPS